MKKEIFQIGNSRSEYDLKLLAKTNEKGDGTYHFDFQRRLDTMGRKEIYPITDTDKRGRFELCAGR